MCYCTDGEVGGSSSGLDHGRKETKSTLEPAQAYGTGQEMPEWGQWGPRWGDSSSDWETVPHMEERQEVNPWKMIRAKFYSLRRKGKRDKRGSWKDPWYWIEFENNGQSPRPLLVFNIWTDDGNRYTKTSVSIHNYFWFCHWKVTKQKWNYHM